MSSRNVLLLIALGAPACMEVVDESGTATGAGPSGAMEQDAEEREPGKGYADPARASQALPDEERPQSEFDPMRKVSGREITHELDWSGSLSLYVENGTGSVSIREGTSADTMVVRLTPTVRLPADAPDEDAAAALSQLVPVVEVSRYSSVDVLTRAFESNASVGADIEVLVPTGFEAALTVSQLEGPVDIAGIARSESLGVYAIDSGDVSVQLGTLTRAFVLTGMGNVTATFDAVEGTDASMFVVEGAGGVTLRVPSSDAYTVRAEAGRSVSLQDVPATCIEETTAPESKTLTCGASGASIDIEASGDPLNDVTVSLD